MDQKKLIEILSLWIANSAVLLLSSVIFSGNVVLGNDRVSIPMAAVLNGLIVTGGMYAVGPLLKRVNFKVKDEKILGVIYLGANVIVVWIVKRFALVLGLGVASVFFVLMVGVFLTLAQWGVMKINGQMKKA